LVEKIEPQAVVQQGVTLFPVLVTLSNQDGALRPGMNGEVSVTIEERKNVLAVPNDAVKNMREAIATAPLLGLDPDSVQAQLRAQFQGRTGMGGGGGQRGQSGASGQRVSSSPGEVALASQQGGRGGFQMPDVTDRQCADVKTAMNKKSAEAKKLDALRERVRSGELDRNASREEQQKIYAAIGVDARVAGACRMREMRAENGGSQTGTTGRQTPTPSASGTTPQLQLGNTERAGNGQRVRPALVFVAKAKSFEPRSVMLGAANFDYSEVVSGLQEGEQVALLTSLALQAQRQQQNDRLRQGMGGVPGMNQNQGGGAGRPGGQGGGGRP